MPLTWLWLRERGGEFKESWRLVPCCFSKLYWIKGIASWTIPKEKEEPCPKKKRCEQFNHVAHDPSSEK